MGLFLKLRRKRYIYLTRRNLKWQVAQLSKYNQLRLNIGSGNLSYEQWLNLDLPFFDLTNPKLWEYFFKNAPINNILMEHVLEHLTPPNVRKSLVLAKKYLHKTGVIRIAVPDKNHPNPAYIEYVRPGGSGAGADDHKSFWNHTDFIKLAEELGYNYDLNEYYLDGGLLVMNDLEPSKGMIQRTARNDSGSQIRDYSSLIIDLSIGSTREA